MMDRDEKVIRRIRKELKAAGINPESLVLVSYSDRSATPIEDGPVTLAIQPPSFTASSA